MAKNKNEESYSPFDFNTKYHDELYSVFWKFLFIPDILVKLLFSLSAGHKDFLASNIIFYWLITIIAIVSCIYFPVLYVLVWKKANSYAGSPNWSVLAKIYVILSASISNSVFMVIGGGRFFS